MLAAALLLACGNRSVELSNPPKLEPSTDPTVVGSINEHVAWLAVDDMRLYWTGTYGPYDYEQGVTNTALHSCDKARCAETLVTYDASTVDSTNGLGVHDGAIYWSRMKNSAESGTFELVSCALSGCNGPPGVLYTSEFGDARGAYYASDAIYFYDRNAALRRLPYAGGDAPVLAQNVGVPCNVTVHGDFLYELESPTFLTAPAGPTLLRLRTDGSGQLETVAEHLKILTEPSVGSVGQFPYTNLAFDDTYVYWTSNTLTGTIQRCPLAGCTGTPESLTAPIRAPTALRLDGGKAYFQYEDESLGNSLTNCTLPHCEHRANCSRPGRLECRRDRRPLHLHRDDGSSDQP
jgi:hypothetical protein